MKPMLAEVFLETAYPSSNRIASRKSGSLLISPEAMRGDEAGHAP